MADQAVPEQAAGVVSEHPLQVVVAGHQLQARDTSRVHRGKPELRQPRAVRRVFEGGRLLAGPRDSAAEAEGEQRGGIAEQAPPRRVRLS